MARRACIDQSETRVCDTRRKKLMLSAIEVDECRRVRLKARAASTCPESIPFSVNPRTVTLSHYVKVYAAAAGASLFECVFS